MPVIELLSDSLINKIAAGEVIERPASVVRELLDNSLDAGCTEVTVEAVNAGIRLIRVSDDGGGMGREDALNCFARHATSKIRTEDDLLNLATMGFRGEALSSIAAVSRLTITTAPRVEDPSGIRPGTVVEIHGGVLKSVKDGVFDGTSMEVRDLFYNTPARKKFLKSPSTELYHVMDAVTRCSLANFATGFRLVVDEKESLVLPRAQSVEERISQIFGNAFLKGLVTFDESRGGISVYGLSSKEGTYRKSGQEQYIFVNGRPIRDNTLRHAVYQAYKELLPSGSHPVFFLYLTVDSRDVDFNVHPAKMEVRFANKDTLFQVVHGAVKRKVVSSHVPLPLNTTVPSGGGEAPAIPGQPGQISQTARSTQTDWPLSAPFGQGAPAPSGQDLEYGGPAPVPQPRYEPGQLSTEVPGLPHKLAEAIPMPYLQSHDFIYVGDVFAVYATLDGMAIIDHHAAHERVLYEKLREGFGLAEYRLLFPLQVRLPQKEFSLLATNVEELRHMGIDVEEFGSGTLIVKALPAALKDADLIAILSDVAAALIETGGTSPIEETKNVVAGRIACHASVRGKNLLAKDELNRLIADLDSTKDPHHCPHGRPTRIYLTQDDLRKMFKRK
ncbi:MAG: DNA mismatch repair endonuclease MutL [Nitrospirae bacterium]|nr:DNA mismatch repair endonuclease MutL [Nitrospirota bacterium]